MRAFYTHLLFVHPLRQKKSSHPNRFSPRAARADIKDAGNCYALDLNTACIMLLMRVAEKGLRVLAREQRVKFPIPLELQEWHNVIVAIEKKVDKFEAWPRCAGKKEVLEFYRGALRSEEHTS